ncbi:50S ribosomal protein L12, apicoplast, putative [Plasmodium sp. gorilla clade G2]|uniref:50S ribosomal protein L12, apicoplast, putative n=1 Tax=Plasmodium sp. gorilla clade G2 TaxID=880535 RepID=UPI000D2052FE|nr:50S ribosomal protein L12, apicoplast, putative [Plasmodium sp. gorilla clade G2]SOV11864.1 50S ribosomal protein L12, apicoplast, putative [Plasmodium sp. gorilla clade G2]
MKSVGSKVTKLIGKILFKKEKKDRRRKNNKTTDSSLFVIIKKRSCLLLYIILSILYITYCMECIVCVKISKNDNWINRNKFFFLENKINNDHYGKKSFINNKRKHISKKDNVINNHKNFKLKSSKVDEIIESLKNLTLLEASELVKKIEITFSVDTKQNLNASSSSGQENKQNEADGKDNEEDEENKVYDLILENIEPNKKIPIIKIVKEIKKDLNLKQAKDLVDNLPQTLFEKVNKETADKWKTKLTEAGGIVKLK